MDEKGLRLEKGVGCFSSRECRTFFSSQSPLVWNNDVSPQNPRFISREKQTASSLRYNETAVHASRVTLHVLHHS